RSFEHFGDLAEQRPGPRVVHPLTRVDERPLGVEEKLGRRFDRLRIGSAPQAGGWRVRELAGYLLLPYVGRNLDEDGPWPPGPRLGERAAQGGHDCRRGVHLL